MQFTKEFLLLLMEYVGDNGYGGKLVQDEIIIIGEHYHTYKLVFEYENKFYAVEYIEGENIEPFEEYNMTDLIEVKEVHPIEKTIIIYE